MGRGRAKAKQTKVARQLKYSAPNTDFDSLQRELSNGEGQSYVTDTWSDDDSRNSEDEWHRA
ncbi:DUF3073 domain-containing protein [Gordonia sp. PDNC005]|jgi:hypothetical protein|uniref:DUF3073 domain-containing protein n=1 Tax=unclassified Gordonia (in: high G+C Gram-positive bacteria) TaxID=2657482 RepID=UPI00196247E6|nr:DUF3073 domain-containing protein [Gordonia sp. PDNC005]MDR2279543.1 DUF3073 domain-containing protein [Gordonia sp. (in: high G+C Gram-positive bacteria)]QRY62979.1 DUF3073 domain-containing protein [Gordonia sp. PDNC005]